MLIGSILCEETGPSYLVYDGASKKPRKDSKKRKENHGLEKRSLRYGSFYMIYSHVQATDLYGWTGSCTTLVGEGPWVSECLCLASTGLKWPMIMLSHGEPHKSTHNISRLIHWDNPAFCSSPGLISSSSATKRGITDSRRYKWRLTQVQLEKGRE